MATEEQHTPPKTTRRGGSKNEKERQQSQQQNSLDAASAALNSPLNTVLKSTTSPQLLWLPKLPNEESPLLLKKFQVAPAQPPSLPPIRALAAAEFPGRPPGLTFLKPLPLVGGSNFPYLRGSTTTTPTKHRRNTPIVPLWSARNSQNGSFKTFFGGNLLSPPKTKTTSTGLAELATTAADAEPQLQLHPPSVLPLPLHHQSSFTFPPAPAQQEKHRLDSSHKTTSNTRNVAINTNKSKYNDDADNPLISGSGGSGSGGSGKRSNSGDGTAAAPLSARPAHRRRKKPRVHSTAAAAVDGDDGGGGGIKKLPASNIDPSSTTTTTSDDGSHGGGSQRGRNRRKNGKKVQWANPF